MTILRNVWNTTAPGTRCQGVAVPQFTNTLWSMAQRTWPSWFMAVCDGKSRPPRGWSHSQLSGRRQSLKVLSGAVREQTDGLPFPKHQLGTRTHDTGQRLQRPMALRRCVCPKVEVPGPPNRLSIGLPPPTGPPGVCRRTLGPGAPASDARMMPRRYRSRNGRVHDWLLYGGRKQRHRPREVGRVRERQIA